jgi:hypothetical protein
MELVEREFMVINFEFHQIISSGIRNRGLSEDRSTSLLLH